MRDKVWRFVKILQFAYRFIVVIMRRVIHLVWGLRSTDKVPSAPHRFYGHEARISANVSEIVRVLEDAEYSFFFLGRVLMQELESSWGVGCENDVVKMVRVAVFYSYG